MSTERIRLTIALPEEDVEVLERFCERFNINRTDAIRRAIALAKLYLEQDRSGRKIMIEDHSGKTQVITFL